MQFLFTFATTTAAFKAEKALRGIGLKAEAEAVPFALSKTCYGLGVAFESPNSFLAKEALKKQDIEWRRLWIKDGDNYKEE